MPHGVGLRDVIWFNWPTYVAAALVVVAATAVLWTGLPAPANVLVALGGAFAAWWTVASILAAWWVFNASGVTRWGWVPERVGEPSRWLNLTSGFDDTTTRLRVALPRTQGQAVDLFDPLATHDATLRRARAAFPPPGGPLAPGRPLPIRDSSLDVVFLLMAAHELEPAETRAAVFEDVARTLRPTGRLVIVEFPANRLNWTIFGPGAMHFEPAGTWRGLAGGAGLRRVDELELTPFVRGFVFEKPAD